MRNSRSTARLGATMWRDHPIDGNVEVCEPSVVGADKILYSNKSVTEDEDDHHWAVVIEACDLEDLNDGMLKHAVTAIRDAYGEAELKAMAAEAPLQDVPDAADGVSSTFATDHLLRAFRSSLPNPDAEGNKPEHLKNYRAETAELLAREALNVVYAMATPPALHATKGNRNQPILGFDGWSVMDRSSGELALVLLQVKATDDEKRPPGEAAKLIVECGRVSTDVEKLKGFLMACIFRCKGTPFATALMNMVVELETTSKITNTVVAPVLIRGLVAADLEDLTSLRGAAGTFQHAKARGLSLSIGANLTAFGRKVMERARQND